MKNILIVLIMLSIGCTNYNSTKLSFTADNGASSFQFTRSINADLIEIQLELGYNTANLFADTLFPIMTTDEYFTTLNAGLDTISRWCGITYDSLPHRGQGLFVRSRINSKFANITSSERYSQYSGGIYIYSSIESNPTTEKFGIKAATGAQIIVDWGKTDRDTLIGNNGRQYLQKTYTVTGGKYIRIYGDLDEVETFNHTVATKTTIRVADLNHFTNLDTLDYHTALSTANQNGTWEDLPTSPRYIVFGACMSGELGHFSDKLEYFMTSGGCSTDTYLQSKWFPSQLWSFNWTGNGNINICIDSLNSGMLDLCMDGSTEGINVHGSVNNLGVNNPNMYYLEIAKSIGNITGKIDSLPVKLRDLALADNANPDLLHGDIANVFDQTYPWAVLKLTNAGVNIEGNIEECHTRMYYVVVVNTPGVVYGGGAVGAWTLERGMYVNNSWTTAMIDGFLNAFATSAPTVTGSRVISFNYASNESRSSASDAAVSTLTTKGFTIQTKP